MKKKKVVIFTGNRAEYGLQYPIIKAISEHPKLEYFLLVSGAHLQEDFGNTKQEIEKDGFEVYGEVEILSPEETLAGNAYAIGSGIINMSKILKEISPDMLVVYADRFEGFAAVISGSQMAIPVAHIEGGDLTDGGALDDSVRHAMTKLSHLHFTTNEDAANRILKMGEESWRVYNVGLPVIDLINNHLYASYNELQCRLNLSKEQPIVLFTQHSVTTEFDLVYNQITPSLEAMRELSKKGIQVIITYPNNDTGSSIIIEELTKLKKEKLDNVQIHNSLGRYFYHGVLNFCGKEGIGVCVGNSSSGIKETPAFGCPTINIGSRQSGRLRADNVVDVNYDKNIIIREVENALFNNEFRDDCKNCDNPYGKGDAGKKIADIIASSQNNMKLIQKKMSY